MNPTIIVNVLVGIGAFAGRAIGGAGGFLVGCPLGLGVALIITEQMAGRRDLSGFWLRNRGAFLNMGCAAICALVGEYIAGNTLGFFIGLFVGIYAGEWLAGQMGWAGERLESELNFRAAFVQVLVSAATVDGPMTEKKQQIIRRVGRDVLSPLGYGDESDVASLVDGVQQESIPVANAAQFAAACPPELQQALFYNVLSILYCEGSLSTTRRQWLEVLTSGIADKSLFAFFERMDLGGPEQRRQWLAELDLNDNATDEDIRKAYRRRAQEYHPDRHQGLPDHIRRLAEAKMAAVSEAYRNLTDGNHAGPGRLYLRSGDGATSFCREMQEVVTCACWLCGQKNRIASAAPTDSARCGQCHSLLGLPFDLAQGVESAQATQQA